MTIYDIDFNQLYKQHLIACNHYNLPPEKWDKKAVKLVDDLDDMIDKLCAKAKKRVYLTSVTQRHFLDEGVFAAIGREDIGFPTYIYLLNRLYQKGIQANLSFIETESGRFMGKTYEDLLGSVEFSLGPLNENERLGLTAFYRQKQQNNEPIKHGQRKWALICWDVD